MKLTHLTYYLKIKGKLEDDVKRLPFRVISILQPGQLDGNRQESRPMEKLALKMVYALNKIGFFKKYRPIQASEVATAMICVADKSESKTYKLDELFVLENS